MRIETTDTPKAPASIWGPDWGKDAQPSVDKPGLQLPMFNIDYLWTRVCRDRKDLGWSRADFDAAVREYKVLWANARAEPDQFFLVPQNADAIWHLHLLFTHNYENDSKAYFGKFLHHHPEEGDGMRAPECAFTGGTGGCMNNHPHLTASAGQH